MDKTIFITLLILAALAMPAWMAWRKANERPWLVGWLLVVGLLALPLGLTLWLQAEWLDIPALNLHGPVKFYLQYLVVLPAFLSLCALGGGLAYLLAPLALALLLSGGRALGEAFRDVEWRQDEEDENHNSFRESDPYKEMYGTGSLYETELLEGFEDSRENAW